MKITRKKLVEKYQNLFNDLTTIVNKTDPYCLIECAHLPEDEYSYEVTGILVGLRKCKSNQDVADLVASIFNKEFNDNRKSIDYLEIATEIYNWYLNIKPN
jgi:hypothetical protein